MDRVDALSQRTPRPGVEQWRNEQNGLVVVRLHYTADPAKRSPEWRRATSRNMHPRAWRREYEIDWTSPEGEPVVPEFRAEKHVAAFGWDRELRLLRFWDFGFVSPVCLFAQLTLWGQLRIRRELAPFNTPLDQLWESVRAVTVELAGPEVWLADHAAFDITGEEREVAVARAAFDAGDPAGTNQTDLGSSAQFLSEKGVLLHTTRPGTEVSYATLRARFLRDVMEPGVGPQPAILIHPACQALRSALGGAFHLNPLPPHRAVKSHPHKDLVDALRYGDDNLSTLTKGYGAELKTMAERDISPLRSGPPERQYEPTRWLP